MAVYLLNRLGQSAFILIAMSVVVFVGIYVIGDPVQVLSNPEATAAEIAQLRTRLGMDQPLFVQYVTFLLSALHGNFGDSFIYNEPALLIILRYMPATLELAMVAMAIAVSTGIPIGVFAGLKPESWTARFLMASSTLGFSLPTFWVGLILIMVFSVWLGWLPSTGRGQTRTVLGVDVSIVTLDGLRHILLPALNLALFKTSLVIRLARAGTREIITQDYIKFARASGLSSSKIVIVHLLKNIMIPIVTVLGLEFGSVIAFSVVTETVFAWPGMGKLLISSIFLLDRPIVVAYLLVIVVLFILLNLVVDVIYTMLDPRIRYSSGAA